MRQRVLVVYEQIVNKPQPSWLSLIDNEGKLSNCFNINQLKENCLLVKLYRKLRKMFLSRRRESNTKPSGLWWDALTIELPGLRWRREDHDVYRFVRATHVLLIQQSRYVSISFSETFFSQYIFFWVSEIFFWVCDKA